MVSKKGRMFVIAYAFVLVFSGPTKNLMKNGEILMDSMNCSQDQLKKAFHEFVNVIKEPYKTIKETISKILPIIKRNAERIKNNLMEMKRNLANVVRNIRKAFSWLANIANLCNSKNESPYEKCSQAFESSIASCRESLGMFNVFCEVAYLVKMFCYSFKTIDYFCEMIDFMSDSVLQNIEKRMKEFMATVEDMFYVSVNFEHKFEFQTNASKSIFEIHKDINREIKSRTSHALKFIDYIKIFLSFYFFFIFIKAIKFRHKYLTILRYKNIYLTNKFHELDEHRSKMGYDKVIPLTHEERRHYIQMTSIKLVRREWRRMLKESVFLFFSTMHLCGILIADYSLFWTMTIIRFYGSHKRSSNDIESDVEIFSIQVAGQGIIAEFCDDLVAILKPLMKMENIDFTSCLPQPIVPNFQKYKMIIALTLFTWILLFCEPYALRFKNVIMEYYFPQISDHRTVWLYHEILRKRTSFLKYARKQARRKLFNDFKINEESMTCFEILKSKISRFWILRKLFGFNKNLSCLLCGKQEKSDNLIKCETSECIGIYCYQCYMDIKKSCTMCKFALYHDDDDDIEIFAENFDSSDEEEDDDIETNDENKLIK